MTWKALLERGENRLRTAGIADAGLDAWFLMEYISGMSRAGYFLNQEEMASSEKTECYLELINKRCSHIPLQHLTGSQEFMGLEFLVSPEVLIPRQDTELLVENLLPVITGKKVLDLCTGSGCIGISLEKLGNPEKVDAVDLSEKALLVAQENARRLQADVHFSKSDMFQNITETYDVIVSNPPYITSSVINTLMPEVKEHEPRMALDGGEDGLSFYRQIARESKQYLAPNGMLWLEIGYDQGESVSGLLEKEGFNDVKCLKDLCGLDRVVCGIKK
ncbi:MAG: peptide chain release factor N(5)-glutamine methyltransferase [Lachnospiraceae bacterium]|nr:peptide chain release factor N(5)-glutamine methyltransferase [Lachnospiraceae bacterium]